MKEILVKHRNGTIEYFTVSDEDYEWVAQWRWCISSLGYICRTSSKHTIHLQRAIMEHLGYDLTGLVVDHKDGNPRNNRRENLRPCTYGQNAAAGKTQRNKSSLYRGVSWYKRTQRWYAYITQGSKLSSLGYFASEDDAARAYNVAALTAWGEFAVLNDVPVIQYTLPKAA